MAAQKFKNERIFPLFLLSSVICFHFVSTQSTPLITWKYDDSLPTENVISGHSLSATEAFNKYMKPLFNTKVVLMFLQDELSIDDFTKYSSSFSYLQKFVEKESPLVLPSLSSSVSSVVRKYVDGKLEEVFSSDVSGWRFDKTSLKKDAANLIIIHLFPVHGITEDGKKTIFKENDKIINTILTEVKENMKRFGVIFTAQEPSQLISDLFMNEEHEESSLVSRHLLSTKTQNDSSSRKIGDGTFFNNSGCVFMYATSIQFVDTKHNKTEMLKNNTWTVSGSCATGLLASIDITSKETVDEMESFNMHIEMKMDNSTDEWYCQIITITGNYSGLDIANNFECGAFHLNASRFEKNVSDSIRASNSMSFACNKLTFTSTLKDNKTYGLILGGFQLQPNIVGGEFNPETNCVGFFTIGILTGIVVTIVLALGLMFGLVMMMNIQTPDRFDDPKGQMISVPTQE